MSLPRRWALVLRWQRPLGATVAAAAVQSDEASMLSLRLDEIVAGRTLLQAFVAARGCSTGGGHRDAGLGGGELISA